VSKLFTLVLIGFHFLDSLFSRNDKGARGSSRRIRIVECILLWVTPQPG